jgi:hypothetical protein
MLRFSLEIAAVVGAAYPAVAEMSSGSVDFNVLGPAGATVAVVLLFLKYLAADRRSRDRENQQKHEVNVAVLYDLRDALNRLAESDQSHTQKIDELIRSFDSNPLKQAGTNDKQTQRSDCTGIP